MRQFHRHTLLSALAISAVGFVPLSAMAQAAPAMGAPCCVAAAPVTPTTLNFTVSADQKKAPDMATMGAGVVTTAKTAKAAMEDNARKMSAAFVALKAAGIADKDMQTSGVQLSPQYDYTNGTRPRIVGYQAANRVTLKLRKIDQIGAVMDALVAQGINEIDGPNFGIENPEAMLDQARGEAMATAMRRAELYAKAAGMRVKRIVSINESGGYTPPQPMPMMMARAAMADSAAPTPVAAGEVSYSIQISLQVELEK
ncbi:MAG: SIMPL domain-containing protein [Hyphomonadaceae bacterium]|nr:SIMPL domain-containing protein [Hyphomonadaceae bacterium]